MAFFDPQEVLLAGGNRFFCIRKGELRIKPAGVICNELCRWILCNRKKDIFLTEKAVKQFFIYFFNDEGASSYNF
jgi:hypothetical protein